ncbi:MAG TPA: DinB family protein [Streptosporangiaceae bacterium]|nr:DinB family protein [Streptosporangiaceae bacterium]
MTVERVIPPYEADERAMLIAWLDFHRATLAVKCDGLTEEQLRQQAVPPSNLSLLGLVRHMAEVERNWFRSVLEGEERAPIFSQDMDWQASFRDVAVADVSGAFSAWRAECEDARALVAAAPSLDVAGERGGERFSLRWVLVHMIEEYARHNGHADLLRERIDGSTGP